MPKVIQDNDQVAEVDTDDDEDQEQVMENVLVDCKSGFS